MNFLLQSNIRQDWLEIYVFNLLPNASSRKASVLLEIYYGIQILWQNVFILLTSPRYTVLVILQQFTVAWLNFDAIARAVLCNYFSGLLLETFQNSLSRLLNRTYN
jgi:hypothetical protein